MTQQEIDRAVTRLFGHQRTGAYLDGDESRIYRELAEAGYPVQPHNMINLTGVWERLLGVCVVFHNNRFWSQPFPWMTQA